LNNLYSGKIFLDVKSRSPIFSSSIFSLILFSYWFNKHIKKLHLKILIFLQLSYINQNKIIVIMRDNFNDTISFKLQSENKYTLRIGTCNLIFLNFKMITALFMKKIIRFHLKILFSILREKDIYFEMCMGLSNFCHYFKISIIFCWKL
jgi:hypothetical protein